MGNAGARVSDLLAFTHAFSALCAFGIAGVLKGAALSPHFRLRIGASERERSYNFSLVALFLFALCLDLVAASARVSELAHAAATILASITGAMALGLFVMRLTVWKK